MNEFGAPSVGKGDNEIPGTFSNPSYEPRQYN